MLQSEAVNRLLHAKESEVFRDCMRRLTSSVFFGLLVNFMYDKHLT